MAIVPTIKRTNTILYCKKWEATLAFYRDKLGLEIAYECGWLVEFRISPTAYLSVADQDRTTISSAAGEGITLSFQIDDLQTVHQALTQIGLMPSRISFQVMGADVFYLFDPEGTRIEFWSPDSN